MISETVFKAMVLAILCVTMSLSLTLAGISMALEEIERRRGPAVLFLLVGISLLVVILIVAMM